MPEHHELDKPGPWWRRYVRGEHVEMRWHLLVCLAVYGAYGLSIVVTSRLVG